jgi:hypothetical protein
MADAGGRTTRVASRALRRQRQKQIQNRSARNGGAGATDSKETTSDVWPLAFERAVLVLGVNPAVAHTLRAGTAGSQDESRVRAIH